MLTKQQKEELDEIIRKEVNKIMCQLLGYEQGEINERIGFRTTQVELEAVVYGIPLPPISDYPTFAQQVQTELEHAKKKHPFFANRALLTLEEKQAKELLVKERYILDRRIESGDVSGIRVLKCELAEAQEAYSRKDYAHCMKELAQVGCVVERIAEMVKAESEGDK